MVSVELFKKYLIESEADFQSYNDLELEKNILLIVQSDISQTVKIIFEKFKINQSEFLEGFLLELAEFCCENSLSNDPVVLALKTTNYSSFNDKIEFIENLKIAIKRSQHSEIRKIMTDLEIEIEADELAIALQRIDRKEKKNKLIELSAPQRVASFDFEGSNNSSHEPPPNVYVKNTFKPRLLVMSRVAAVLILFLIPIGLYFMFDDKISGFENTKIAKNSNKNLNKLNTTNKNNVDSISGAEKDIIYQNQSDLSPLNLPEYKGISQEVSVIDAFESYGFAKPKIKVIISDFSSQYEYVINRKSQIDKSIKELQKSKSDKEKQTLSLLQGLRKKLNDLELELMSKNLGYTFDGKVLSLSFTDTVEDTIFTIINLNNSDVDRLFLKKSTKYFSFVESSGKLIEVIDLDTLEELKRIIE
jgi:hypothetical protein